MSGVTFPSPVKEMEIFCLNYPGPRVHKTVFVARLSVGGPRGTTLVKKVFCFKLDAMSIPEALATTIRILLMFSIVLAHRCNPGVWPRPAPLGTPHRHPIGTPSAPRQHGSTQTGVRCATIVAGRTPDYVPVCPPGNSDKLFPITVGAGGL